MSEDSVTTKRAVGCVLVGLLFMASSAEAQLCTGVPSFSQAPLQLGVSAAFPEYAQELGGHFARGGAALFAGGGVGVLVIGDVPPDFVSSQTTVSAFTGADLGVSRNRRVFVCPLAGVSLISGPDVGPVHRSAVGLSGGGSVGVVATDTDALMVVPTFGLTAAWRHMTLELEPSNLSYSDTYGIANLGVGLVFKRTIGIIPGISIPFSIGNAEPDVAFSLRFAFNFGR